MSVNSDRPMVMANADTMYGKLLGQKKIDPKFTRTVFIETPIVENVPEGCIEIEKEF